MDISGQKITLIAEVYPCNLIGRASYPAALAPSFSTLEFVVSNSLLPSIDSCNRSMFVHDKHITQPTAQADYMASMSI